MSITVWTNFYRMKICVDSTQRKAINRCKMAHLKLARNFNHLKYLHRCKRYNIVPDTLQLKLPFSTKDENKVRNKIGFLLLHQRIRDLHEREAMLKNQELAARHYMERVLPSKDFITVWLWILEIEKQEFFRVRQRQIRKFEILQGSHEEKIRQLEVDISESVKVINVSSYVLKEDELALLQKGLGYSLCGFPSSDLDFGASIELCAKNFRDREQLVKEVEYNLSKGKNIPALRRYSKDRKALNSLKNNSQIVVLKADKGGSVVVMDKLDYFKKSELIFEDGSYVQLLEDPSEEIVEEVSKTLRRYIRKGWLDSKVLKDCENSNIRIPSLYCVPKVHKVGMPMRPIVSCFDTFLGSLAKWLVGILNPLKQIFSKLGTSVSNNKDIVDVFKTFKDTSVDLVSFDIVNLFGSLEIDRVLDVLETLLVLDARLCLRTNLPISKLLNLVSLCLKNNYFTFQGNFYLQVKGIAMGSPLPPVLAELYLCEFESKIIKEPQFDALSFWYRYVDDVLSALKGGKEEGELFLNWINNIDPCLKFTMELEIEGNLPFLDLNISKVEGGFNLSVYEKPCSAQVCLNFHSYHHIAVKKSVVKGYINRIIKCSSEPEVDKVKLVAKLKSNGYPGGFISELSKKYKPEDQNKVFATSASSKKRFSVPFERGITDKLKTKVNVGFQPVFRGGKNVGGVLSKNYKDSSAKREDCGGVIYRINCKHCNKFYIGETGRVLGLRVHEHKLKVSNRDRNNGIAVHVLDTSHDIDFDNIKILATESNIEKRKFKEAMFIKAADQNNLMNLNDGVSLMGNWEDVLRKLKHELN